MHETEAADETGELGLNANPYQNLNHNRNRDPLVAVHKFFSNWECSGKVLILLIAIKNNVYLNEVCIAMLVILYLTI